MILLPQLNTDCNSAYELVFVGQHYRILGWERMCGRGRDGCDDRLHGRQVVKAVTHCTKTLYLEKSCLNLLCLVVNLLCCVVLELVVFGSTRKKEGIDRWRRCAVAARA